MSDGDLLQEDGMVRRRLSLRLMALGLTLGMAALPTSVAASGFQLIEQNASGLGNAFAGQAAGVDNASAIYFNPAALTKLKGWNIVASVEPIKLGTTFADERLQQARSWGHSPSRSRTATTAATRASGSWCRTSTCPSRSTTGSGRASR